MSWDDRRALRASEPSADGLAGLSEVLGEPLTVVGRLAGGVATSTHALATPTRQLVVKRFIPSEDWAPMEWERLHLAQATPLPTPEPVVFDPAGVWFGGPAIVMSRLRGRVVFPPDGALLGSALAVLHTTPIPDPVPAVLRRPPLWTEPGSNPDVFAHCDFHPGNVLIEGGEVTGVVDWSSVRLASPELDVALLRLDLTIIPGGDEPDRAVTAYEATSGRTLRDMDLWDDHAADRAIEWGHEWIESWTELGVPMTPEHVRSAAESLKKR